MERVRTIGYRLARIAAALAVAVPVGLSMTITAEAATCTATGFIRDNINLTAAQIGGTVSGSLDATGCDIGVYFATPGSVMPGAQIFGANYFGVVNDGTSVNVEGASIHGIGHHPAFDGTQHGVGIYFVNGASGAIDGNTVSAYQKGAIVVTEFQPYTGPATTATVTNNTVTGLGPIAFIAQNGIQVSRGAVATVRGNDISDNFYTGEGGLTNAAGASPEGFEYFSTGLLLFEAGPGTKTSDNQFSGNQHNFANVP